MAIRSMDGSFWGRESSLKEEEGSYTRSWDKAVKSKTNLIVLISYPFPRVYLAGVKTTLEKRWKRQKLIRTDQSVLDRLPVER